MKIVLIAERESLKEQIQLHFKPQGSEIIQYWNPIKAMDNIDELEPDLILFAAQDFPRHWKPFLTFLRNNRTKEQTIFILLKQEPFPFDEASKAMHLGANGIVNEDLSKRVELNRLKVLIERYKGVYDGRKVKRLVPSDVDKVGFLFCHPSDFTIITGEVTEISKKGLCFKAHHQVFVKNIHEHTILYPCTLRIGEKLFTVSALVMRNDTDLSLNFSEMDSEIEEQIETYLNEHHARELSKVMTSSKSESGSHS